MTLILHTYRLYCNFIYTQIYFLLFSHIFTLSFRFHIQTPFFIFKRASGASRANVTLTERDSSQRVAAPNSGAHVRPRTTRSPLNDTSRV